MMKKLMVLSLVLAIGTLSSAAVAAVQLVPSATEVLPGEVVTIELIADFAASGFGLQLASDGGGVAEVGEVNPVFSILPSPGQAKNAEGVLITGATGSIFGNQVAAGGALYTFTWTAPVVDAATLVTISAVNIPDQFLKSFVQNASTFAQVDIGGVSTAINVIPEPMTMGLLGLGALFLRRRK